MSDGRWKAGDYDSVQATPSSVQLELEMTFLGSYGVRTFTALIYVFYFAFVVVMTGGRIDAKPSYCVE